ncbi:MAG TPA: tRNA 2-selenouridine synthase, partial [Verrucomicrobiales bacterium]|nr:tRNA 2-selenouridine synthase [Verrucomicrobiales bacterium]HBI32902.1 tRNA 2-selenouridine synthase [Verrucomicrobiales bacterium]
QIDACDWPTFLESILLKHYDLCYRRPGSEDSIYSEPIATVSITSASDSDYENAAAELIAKHS